MNILVAQSGGPTAAINATIAGAIEEARNNNNINNIYGALNGIEGVINKNLVEFSGVDTNLLFKTPAASSALSKVNGGQGPALIYLCEELFCEEKFLTDVKGKLSAGKPILIALSDGLKGKDGEYLGESDSKKVDHTSK